MLVITGGYSKSADESSPTIGWSFKIPGRPGERSSCGDACLQTFNQVGSSLRRVSDTTFGTLGFSQHFSGISTKQTCFNPSIRLDGLDVSLCFTILNLYHLKFTSLRGKALLPGELPQS